jgi:DNA-binding NtrC family response regulator
MEYAIRGVAKGVDHLFAEEKRMLWHKHITNCEVTLPATELVKRTRIVVIDDERTTFPFDVLQEQGYSIDYWPDVKDLDRLERGFYDIIILDIGGIGRELDETNEGIAVLKHLKKLNPAQVVVAFSGQSYESAKIPFFQLADQYVPKPTSAITWKEIIDDLLKTKVTVGHYWETMRQALRDAGASEKAIKGVEASLVKAASGRHVDLCKTIQKLAGPLENAVTLAAIGAKIVALCNTQ